MAGIRKSPTLRVKRVNGIAYRVTDLWKPDGRRGTLSFGPVSAMDDADAHVVFGKWLRLFQTNPHKTLGYRSPFEAIEKMIDGSAILTVGEFRDKYHAYATEVFRLTRNGDINPNFQRLKLALTFLEPYSTWPLASFGPDEFRAVQNAMVAYRYRCGVNKKAKKDRAENSSAESPPAPAPVPDRPLTRSSLNDHADQLRRMWAWGVGRGIVTHQQEQALHEVKTLRRGHPGTIDKHHRRPVTPAEFEMVAAAVNATVADMMRVMWLAPIRPSEVCAMRPVDFVKDDPECWLYIPNRDHVPTGDSKTLGHDQARAVPIARRLQAILSPRISATPNPTNFIFSPKVAVQEFANKRFANRMTPLSSGNRPGTNRVEHPMITPRERYDDESFTKAIKAGCRRGGVEKFTAYDLRRTTITRARAVLGRDAAAVLTGHADPRTTDLYLLSEVQEAVKAAKELDAAMG